MHAMKGREKGRRSRSVPLSCRHLSGFARDVVCMCTVPLGRKLSDELGLVVNVYSVCLEGNTTNKLGKCQTRTV